MQGRQLRDVADTSLQPLREQGIVPFQFNGWHGVLVQDFPMDTPEQGSILYDVSCQQIVLLPIEKYGTVLVSLTRGYDPEHGPFPDLTAQAVLFTADPLERRETRVTASDAWAAFEQVWAYFSLPSREEEFEPSGVITFAIAQAILQGNAYYRLQGWPAWRFVFFPSSIDRALLVLMVYPGEGTRCSARVVRFSPNGSRCSQTATQAESTDQVLACTVYRYRYRAIAQIFLRRLLQWKLPSWLSVPLRWAGGVAGILLALFFQLATVGFLLGILDEQAPPSSGIGSVFFPLFGLFGACVVLLPVYCPLLVISPPNHRPKRLQRWLIGFLLAGEYSAFLYATAKSLSENRGLITLMKTDESTSQLQESLIGDVKLLPADQESPPAVEPGEETLNDPAPGFFGGFQRVCSQGLSFLLLECLLIPSMVVRVETYMRLVASQIEVAVDNVIVIASVHAQVLRLLHGWLGTSNRQCIQRGPDQFHVMTIGSLNHHGKRKTATITQDAPLGPLLAAIGGSGSDGGLSERGFDHRAIHALPVPVNALQVVIVLQLCLPQAMEEALRFPETKAIVDGTGCSHFSGQCIPLDARAQHVDDRRKHLPIIGGWTPSFGMGWAFWDQGAHSLPQFIADFPRSSPCHGSFSPRCFLFSLYHRFSDKL